MLSFISYCIFKIFLENSLYTGSPLAVIFHSKSIATIHKYTVYTAHYSDKIKQISSIDPEHNTIVYKYASGPVCHPK